MAIFIMFDGLGPELFENINKLSPIQRLAQLNSVLFLLKMQNKRKAFDKMRRRPLKMLKQKNVSWEAISVEKNKVRSILAKWSLLFLSIFFTKIYILAKNDKVINDLKCAQRLQIGSEHEGR